MKLEHEIKHETGKITILESITLYVHQLCFDSTSAKHAATWTNNKTIFREILLKCVSLNQQLSTSIAIDSLELFKTRQLRYRLITHRGRVLNIITCGGLTSWVRRAGDIKALESFFTALSIERSQVDVEVNVTSTWGELQSLFVSRVVGTWATGKCQIEAPQIDRML